MLGTRAASGRLCSVRVRRRGAFARCACGEESRSGAAQYDSDKDLNDYASFVSMMNMLAVLTLKLDADERRVQFELWHRKLKPAPRAWC